VTYVTILTYYPWAPLFTHEKKASGAGRSQSPHTYYTAEVYEQMLNLPDSVVWEIASQTDPPARFD
jgi:hypothetical protein